MVGYKLFSGQTYGNSTTVINGGAEVEYSYTSATYGSGTATFYSTDNGCNPDPDTEECLYKSITITACLPADATGLTLLNGSDPVSGTNPRTTPTITGTSCTNAAVLLTTVGDTMDSLISTL